MYLNSYGWLSVVANRPYIHALMQIFCMLQAMLFIDYKRATVSAGNGGNGRVSFLSLFANEFAGPDGGDGGNGAHIIFKG